MCGIAGFFTPDLPPDAAQVLRRMNDTIAHRGPDARGEWCDASRGIALAHRRLAIVDLSEEGRQPMHSTSGRYVVVFNGEIYNFLRIRAELERLGARFRGHSDTEVMLEAFETWGLEASLQRFIGMFAFALWDSAANELILARDRLGKKPLYYALTGRGLIFGSELKALRAFPGLDGDVDRQALAQLVRYAYIPAPRTIYAGARKLDAAHFARFTARGHRVLELERRCFWNAAQIHAAAAGHSPALAADEATDELDALLRDAVQLRMIADVPLGAFLSGGIDSSLVVALMQALSSRPVRTFTIGFKEDAYNEAHYARQVARHLGTDHTEVYLTPVETLAVIPQLPQMYDEPFADASQIPTALVCTMARQHVTVALSGDGGDEGFGGYSRYEQARRICRRMAAVPSWLRRALSGGMRHVPLGFYENMAKLLPAAGSGKLRPDGFSHRVMRLADRLGCVSSPRLYQHLMSYWFAPEALVIDGRDPGNVLDVAPEKHTLDEFTEQMMLLDTLTYLPDDILVKVDRASMAVALEVRAPLLDQRVLEFAWRLPLALKLHEGRGKVILRRVLRRYVPEALFERPKTGFGVPIYRWLRGPLRDWAEELLAEKRLAREGYFRPRPIRQVWQSLLSGQSDWAYGGELLWSVLMFQAWLADRHAAAAPALCKRPVSAPSPLSAAHPEHAR